MTATKPDIALYVNAQQLQQIEDWGSCTITITDEPGPLSIPLIRLSDHEAAIAEKDAFIQEMVRLAAKSKRPAYDEQQRRIDAALSPHDEDQQILAQRAAYQQLFDLLYREHGITPLESELIEIVECVAPPAQN